MMSTKRQDLQFQQPPEDQTPHHRSSQSKEIHCWRRMLPVVLMDHNEDISRLRCDSHKDTSFDCIFGTDFETLLLWSGIRTSRGHSSTRNNTQLCSGECCLEMISRRPYLSTACHQVKLEPNTKCSCHNSGKQKASLSGSFQCGFQMIPGRSSRGSPILWQMSMSPKRSSLARKTQDPKSPTRKSPSRWLKSWAAPLGFQRQAGCSGVHTILSSPKFIQISLTNANHI